MMRAGAILFLLLAASMPLCAQQMCPAKDRGALEKRFTDWAKAYKARDLAGTMDIFANDLNFSFQGAPDATRAQLEKGYVAEFSKPASGEWVPQFEEFECSGDLAFVRSTWVLHVSGPNGAVETRARNRSVDILRRRDGKWYIFRSLNYPVAAPAK